MRAFVITLTILMSSGVSGEVKFSGYLKNYSVIQDEINNEVITFDRLYRSKNNSRLMWNIFNGNQVWQFHYEVGFEINSAFLKNVTAALQPDRQPYRLSDIGSFIGPDDQKNSIIQNLDRFNVQFQLAAGDLTIGRQAISFGAARIINPTDVFLPFDVRTLNTEYRVGIDAIRFQKPIGQLGELDMGIVLGADARPENSAGFFRAQTNLAGSDIQFMAMRFSEQTLMGIGIQSSLADLGFWFEAAQVTGDQDYFRASTGVDYAFSETTFGMIEYHFSEAGSSDPADYLLQQQDAAYTAGGVFLLGRHYLIPSLSVQFSALFSASIQAIINLDDHSVFLSLVADYSLSDNLYMGLGYYFFSGDDFSLASTGQAQFGSEYGGNPNSIFASLRYYF